MSAAADDAGAALKLIRTFGEHGASVEAMQAVLNANPMVIAIALGFLTSRVIWTERCPACGHLHEHEHDPAQHAYPGLRLVPGEPGG